MYCARISSCLLIFKIIFKLKYVVFGYVRFKVHCKFETVLSKYINAQSYEKEGKIYLKYKFLDISVHAF